MTRQEEINVLQSLKGDTYFNQYFSDKDIDQMCQNIANDFAIESGCTFVEKADRITEAYEKKLSNLIEKVIESGLNKEGTKALYAAIGMNGVIGLKHEKHIALSQEEINYLVETYVTHKR